MSKILDNIARQKLNASKKEFSRAKALHAITADNCGEDRFVKHKNKHVRARASHLAARSVAPDTARSEMEVPETQPEEVAAE